MVGYCNAHPHAGAEGTSGKPATIAYTAAGSATGVDADAGAGADAGVGAGVGVDIGVELPKGLALSRLVIAIRHGDRSSIHAIPGGFRGQYVVHIYMSPLPPLSLAH